MTDLTPTRIYPARGEMRTWSDLEGPIGPVGGPSVERWLDDTLPTGGRWLLIGPHADAILVLAQARAESVTVLLRSASDAETTRDRFPAALEIICGALDALRPGDDPFDVVLVTDGLDRVLTPDSADLTWRQRFTLVEDLAAPEGTVVLGLSNELAATTLLDARVALDRYGDEEWRPIHSDDARPNSAAQFLEAVSIGGRTVTSVWTTFGPTARPGLIATRAVTDSTGPGRLVADAAARAAGQVGSPLLAQPDEAIASAARAGALSSLANGFLVTIGGTPAPDAADAYLAVDSDMAVTAHLAVSACSSESVWVVTGSGGDEHRSLDTPSVESELRALAEREDVPAFRALCGRLGDWMTERGSSTVPVALDRLVADQTGFSPSLPASPLTEDLLPAAAFAGAWFRFQDRLLGSHRRHPWPPWVLGDELIEIWSSMAGVAVKPADLSAGRAVADRLADDESVIADSRTCLADAAEARKQLFEARGHIAGLERTIGFRDKQLLTREQRIRQLHSNLVKVQKAQAQSAPETLRRVARVRDPKKVVSAVKKRAVKEWRRAAKVRDPKKVVSAVKRRAAKEWSRRR